MVIVFEHIHLPQREQPGLPRTKKKNSSPSPRNPLPKLIGQDFRKSEHKGQGKLVKGDRQIFDFFPCKQEPDMWYPS